MEILQLTNNQLYESINDNKDGIFESIKNIITDLLLTKNVITSIRINKLIKYIRMYNKLIFNDTNKMISIEEEIYDYKKVFCCNYYINDEVKLYLNTTIYPDDILFLSLQYENICISQYIDYETINLYKMYNNIGILYKFYQNKKKYIKIKFNDNNFNIDDIDDINNLLNDICKYDFRNILTFCFQNCVKQIYTSKNALLFDLEKIYFIFDIDTKILISFLGHTSVSYNQILQLNPYYKSLDEIIKKKNTSLYQATTFYTYIESNFIFTDYENDDMKIRFSYNININKIFITITPYYEEEEDIVINNIQIYCSFDDIITIDFKNITDVTKIQNYKYLKYEYTEKCIKHINLKIKENNEILYDGTVKINPFNICDKKYDNYINYHATINKLTNYYIFNQFDDELFAQYILNDNTKKFNIYYKLKDNVLTSYKIYNNDIIINNNISLNDCQYKQILLNECLPIINDKFNYYEYFMFNIENINCDDQLKYYIICDQFGGLVIGEFVESCDYTSQFMQKIITDKHILFFKKKYNDNDIIVFTHELLPQNTIEPLQCGNTFSKSTDHIHKKNDDLEIKDRKIINITTHKINNNMEEKNESSTIIGLKIFGNNKKKDGIIGYKAAMTEDGKMCMITLKIPQNAKIAKDEYYDKYKTDRATVISIDRIIFNNQKILKLKDIYMKEEEDCVICYTTTKLQILQPCHHRFCINCIKEIIMKVSKLCPMCHKGIENTIDIDIADIIKSIKKNDNINDIDEYLNKSLTYAYSCVYNNEFKYELGKTYNIVDFDIKIVGKICGPGIYYHTEPLHIIQWFEHLEIYNDYKKMTETMGKNINTDIIWNIKSSLDDNKINRIINNEIKVSDNFIKEVNEEVIYDL
jgi:hypothetical protein